LCLEGFSSQPFSLSSNTESLSYTEGGSSDQWSVHTGMDSPWSSYIDASSVFQQTALSSFSSTDQHFSLSQTHLEFQSLPNIAATDSYNVEPSGLSLGSQVIGYNAENLLLPGNQTLAYAANNVDWHGEMSAIQWKPPSASVSPAVPPIPACVTNASYEGMCTCYLAGEVYSVVNDITAKLRFVL